MKLQPLDIRRQSFAKAFRGYEPAEVDAFLKQVADQQAALMEELRLMEDRVRDAEAKLKHYERVELALQEALETARETGKRAEAAAEREMRTIVQRAEARAEEILRDAERERYSLQQNVRKLSTRQTEVAAKLRGFLMSELEILAQFQGDEPVGFLKLQPASVPAALPPASTDAPPADHHPDTPEAAALLPRPQDAPEPPPLAEEHELQHAEPDAVAGEQAPAEEHSTRSPAAGVALDSPGEDASAVLAAEELSPSRLPEGEALPAGSQVAPSEPPLGLSRWFGSSSRRAHDLPDASTDEPPIEPARTPDAEVEALEETEAEIVFESASPAGDAPSADEASEPEPVGEPVDDPAGEPHLDRSAPPSFAPLPATDAAPPLWDLRSLVTGATDEGNVAGSEAERERIRRILDDLD